METEHSESIQVLVKQNTEAGRLNPDALNTERARAYINGFFRRREEKDICIEEKVNFTAFIIRNRSILIGLDDFYEEECQFAIIKWVVDNRKQLEIDSNSLSVALLYNLIIILEIFPIKTTDFISLKIIEKLKSIKRSVNKSLFECAQRIQRMIYFWEENIKEIVHLNKSQLLLKKKTKRPEEEQDDADEKGTFPRKVRKRNDSEGDSIESRSSAFESRSSSSSSDMSPIGNNKRNYKKVKWKEDIVEEVLYSIDDSDTILS